VAAKVRMRPRCAEVKGPPGVSKASAPTGAWWPMVVELVRGADLDRENSEAQRGAPRPALPQDYDRGWKRRIGQHRDEATLGATSLRSSKRLPTRSGLIRDSPVTFPPGRAGWRRGPSPPQSPDSAMTMGMVVVACMAARVAGTPDAVTMTSTGSRTNSTASAGSWSSWPSASRRAKTRFCPST